MSGLPKPYGFPTTQIPGTEFGGKNIDPVSGTITAPNSVSYSSKSALATAINSVIAAGKVPFGPGRQSIHDPMGQNLPRKVKLHISALKQLRLFQRVRAVKRAIMQQY